MGRDQVKLFSQAFELKAIRTITAGSTTVSDTGALEVSDRSLAAALLLSGVDESWFHYEPCRAALSRIKSISKKRGKIISYDDLLEDTVLDEEFRDVLREQKKRAATNVETAKQLLDGLDKYRKTRSLYFLSKEIQDKLGKSSVDVELLLNDTTNTLTKIRTSNEGLTDQILTVGKDANALDLIDDALSTETDTLLKTGFKEFDDKNGGLPSEGVMLLAATTSGGKSAMRMVLMKNMYRLNMVDVLTVSLEMNARKETRRLLSNISNIPYWKYTKQVLSDEERTDTRKMWRRFHKYGVTNGCKYSLLCPTRGVTITQLLMLIKPYKYKVVAIDYISLLEGVAVDNQWRILGDIVRECKIFSGENKCLVMVLAQLDSEDDRVRYSRAMTEHSDAVWAWNYSKQEQRDLGILPIKQMKARDQQLFPFDLKENFGFMQILNVDDVEAVDRSGGPDPIATPAEDDPLSKQNITYEDGVG